MAPGAWPLAYGRLPGPGTARHLLVGSSQSPPRPGGPTDRDTPHSGAYHGPEAIENGELPVSARKISIAPFRLIC